MAALAMAEGMPRIIRDREGAEDRREPFHCSLTVAARIGPWSAQGHSRPCTR